MPDSFILKAIQSPDAQQPGVFSEAAGQLPGAAADWARDAWHNKVQFAEKTVLNLGESALVGGAISYVIPCRGKAALAVGALMMAPAGYKVVKNLWDANEEASRPGADVHKIGHKLAYNTVDGAYNLGVSFAGGYAGAEVGGLVAESNTAAGAFSRSIRANVFGLGRSPATAAASGELSTAMAPLKTGEPVVGAASVVHQPEIVPGGPLKTEALVADDGALAQHESLLDPHRKPAGPIPEGPPGVLSSLDGVPKSEVTITGKISKVLPDDTDGLPHQRFLVELPDGKQIFIANDTHYGTAVPGLKEGEAVTIKGEWIPQKGTNGGVQTEGVLHWTHKGDGPGLHQGGYIEYGGQRYQLVGPDAEGADASATTLAVSPIGDVLAQTRVGGSGVDLGQVLRTPTGAGETGDFMTFDKDGLLVEDRGHGGGAGKGNGGDRGGGQQHPPVKDGPAGVLTSLEGVPRSEVTVEGMVSKLLADDNKGLPHQRFLIQLKDGSNVFIANDTHYGTFVPDMQVGQPIQIRGEWIPEPGNWEGTETAGVLHWTHKGDAGSNHPGGWIDYGGNRYQFVDMTPIVEAPSGTATTGGAGDRVNK